MQQYVQIPATTDENGQPILPQALTDEQAEGVFRPVDRNEEQTVQQSETEEQQGTLQEVL